MNRQSLIILPLLTLLILGACASPGQQDVMLEQGPAVIESLDINDNEIVLTLSAPFEYTVYKPGDPFTVIVELPGVDAGEFRDRIESMSKGITEIIPTVVEEPGLMTKLEILLQEPSKLIPEVSGNVLTLSVETAGEGEMPQFEAITEEEIPDVEEVPYSDIAMEEEIPFADEGLPIATPIAPEEPHEEAYEGKMAAEEIPFEEPTMVEAGEPAIEPTSLKEKINITDIRFERVKDAVKVIIIADGPVKPNIFPLDGKIVLDFDNVAMKTKIPKEVAYPLKGIRSGDHKDKTRLVLDIMDKASYDVIAIDNSVVISLSTPDLIQHVATGVAGSEGVSRRTEAMGMERPEQVEAAAEGKIAAEQPASEEYIEEGRYTGKKISLDFQDADIVPIFRLFADVSGYNVVVSPEVKGKITMKLINVPWDQALDLVLRTHNLGKQLEGNIIRIAPNKDLAAESEEKARAKDALLKAKPLATKVYAINYAGVDRIKEAISAAKLLSPRGSMTTDERASVIVVNDVADVFPRVQNLIAQLDKPELQVRQVLIEARIVEINTTYVKDLGVQWGVAGRTNDFQLEVGGLNALGTSDFTGNNFIVNMPAAVQQGSGGAIGLGWINAARTLGLDLQLSALERTGNSKLVSNPRIITMNNTPAKITQGRTIYIPVATADKTDVKAIDAVLSLDVTPSIAPGGAVLLKMKISKDEPGDIVAGNISINKNNAETSALINNGETVVIGGIYKTSYIKANDAVPFLSKIPVLGWFFQKKNVSEDSAEILIFVTPKVIDFEATNKK